MTYRNELCGSHYSLAHRLRLFDATVTPTVLYGSSCWTMTLERERRLQTAQRKMLRRILGLGRRKLENDANEHESTDAESSTSSDAAGVEDSEEEEQVFVEESWIVWLERTA